ncbi:hypothetical protein BDY24DRAFT_388516 [Mrakia frigida]|uniref:uncharacterized protein n=1 Tax=Mrakia frigida TaxID=29902 RepID=UPI003FCBF1FC
MLSELKKSSRRNWRFGSDQQGMAMVEMAREIGRWIQALFPLCIELRDELELGYKSLVIMRDVFDQIRNSESR